MQSYKIGYIIYKGRLRGGGVMAAAVYIDVQPAVLDWVIQKTQFENVGSNVAESLAQWRSGSKKPTFRQLEDMSRKTHIPFGYFFLHTPPKEDFGLVEYRTVDSEAIKHPSRNLIDTVSAMQRVQDWMEDYCKENEFDPLPFVGRFPSGGDVRTIVEDIRKELELDIDWFKGRKDAHASFQFLRERITESGVMVMRNGIVGNNTHRKLNVDEFRAFTLVNKYAPLIFINSNDSENGRLFSLLHELAHVWIGRDSLYNEPYGGYEKVNQLEQLCNTIAAEILVPDELFMEQWQSLNCEIGIKLERLSEKYFTCSRFVIALKAFDNGFINREALNRVIAVLRKDYQNWNEAEKKHKGGGGDYYLNFGARWDNRFIRALIESTMNGGTLYTEAYRLTGTHGKTFDNLVKEVRGE